MNTQTFGRATFAEIDLEALKHNYRIAQSQSVDSKVYAVVKANAYGHGLGRITQALHDADGFCVATISEALALREQGVHQNILALEGFLSAEEVSLAAEHHLEVTIHQVAQLEWLQTVKPVQPLDIWLKIDTGMHRLGLPIDQAKEVYEKLKSMKQVRSLRLMTHFACADERHNPFTHKQVDRFLELNKTLNLPTSLGNSAGLMGWSQGKGDVVRPGIMLYGGSPFSGETGTDLGLKPVMTLKSSLIAISEYKTGEAIGYGSTWRCPRDSRIGVVAIGYGDGYPRHMSNGAPVLINGVRCPVVGRVSMDMTSVDLTHLPNAKLGDEVILWGEGLPADEVAQAAGTISYELFCQITARVPLIYKN